ncbi:nitrogenase cofactor biosynthesis protein NifB [Vibrio porteresiae]|uniref:FeMo cofactor biosynthesis protein NifB n=1 Tax=Vibrio porteresiae DSM 19223 TaxID=1123496 RepID=A0ABZ0QIH6_9VIBR|nr:nitrogenase cofactor biosynthesis protein NifB [Vibrio porteresiae]WPC76234.1 nitrogenase cofactor biosynthesis protein NifB [Vibrio porteresiae DSM 19223]
MESPSSSKGSQPTANDNIRHFFSKEVQDQIAQHPCYSQQAHQYARMHLPVAPACNIQCNYCNRKYDCSNESRPGVVSQVMDSAQALRQFSAIKRRAPNLSVVGIAGPGDALANPQVTFATLRQIKRQDPSAQLCISTNGLALEENVEALVELGVHHLTITINCTDPEIGAKIYPWIFHQHRRYKGREAATLLIERQFAGLKKAAQAGLLVKVNTVLIPGINDQHIVDVSEAVKQHGALLHNIMPLISDPAHGTYFGLSGQRGPTAEELQLAREASGGFMPQMTHCQQCRADAVGMLGDGDSHCGSGHEGESSPCHSSHDAEQPLCVAPFLLAIASNGSEHIQTHFGHATAFEIYQFEPRQQQFLFKETREVALYCHGKTDCPEEEEKNAILDVVSDCRILLCSRIGITPWRELEKRGVTPNVDFAFQPIADALKAIARQQSAQVAAPQQGKSSLNEVTATTWRSAQ